MKYIVQYISALILLIFSTFIAWYEGSAIRDNPWEWKYSALFSKILNGDVTSQADISQFDHFIYAAKFNPIFPAIVILCLSYILILSGYLLLKSDTKRRIIFNMTLSVVYFFFGVRLANSPTIGGKYFTFIFLIIASINLVMSILFFLKMKKRNENLRNAMF